MISILHIGYIVLILSVYIILLAIIHLNSNRKPSNIYTFYVQTFKVKIKYTKIIKKMQEVTSQVLATFSFELIHPFSRKVFLYFFSHHLHDR